MRKAGSRNFQNLFSETGSQTGLLAGFCIFW
jgi:hypothetical protein